MVEQKKNDYVYDVTDRSGKSGATVLIGGQDTKYVFH